MKMEKISAEELNDKMVMDSEGSEIGVVHNIVVDAGTGMLTELVVKPATELDTSGFKKEDNYIFIPFEAVKAIRDVIVVDSEKIREHAQ
ncbi:MAG: PRC-barrel domain-containing protein [Methanophagales archaeon]|nr:PRC-barrel domain-containing protein [Methanophagales archaeon]